jgi:hypothetical protein
MEKKRKNQGTCIATQHHREWLPSPRGRENQGVGNWGRRRISARETGGEGESGRGKLGERENQGKKLEPIPLV